MSTRRIEQMWEDGSIVGQKVQHRNQVRTVIRRLTNDTGHGVILDKHIDMFMSWSIDELELVLEDEDGPGA